MSCGQNFPPHFDSVPEGTEWECFAKAGKICVWIPKMPDDGLVPEDVTKYVLGLLELDLIAEAKKLGTRR